MRIGASDVGAFAPCFFATLGIGCGVAVSVLLVGTVINVLRNQGVI